MFRGRLNHLMLPSQTQFAEFRQVSSRKVSKAWYSRRGREVTSSADIELPRGQPDRFTMHTALCNRPLPLPLPLRPSSVSTFSLKLYRQNHLAAAE